MAYVYCRKFHWCAGGLPLVAHGGRGHRPQLPAPVVGSQCHTDHLIVIEITSVFTKALIHLPTYFHTVLTSYEWK